MQTFRCKHCKTKKSIDSEVILSGVSRFCSLGCRRSFNAEQNKKIKEKGKIKKTKKRDKKQNSISFLTKKADKLWSEAVKIEYNYECQYCGKKEYLNSHHLFTRSRKSTRWDLENGICLCSGCHTLSSTFSAHQTGLEFFEWLEGIRGRDWIDNLSKKSRQIVNVTPELIKEHIETLNTYIKNYEK